MKKLLGIIIVILLLVSLVFSLIKLKENRKANKEQASKAEQAFTLLQEIKQRGKLRVAVANNSIDYFSYKGRMMGFKYEMLQHLCDDLGVSMELYVDANITNLIEGVNSNRYDLVARDITITLDRKAMVDFTVPVNSSEQVLIQRRPEYWYLMASRDLDTVLVNTQLDLAGKNIVVPTASSYADRLRSLSEEIGDSIHIIEDDEQTVEGLISDLVHEKIDYTVAERPIAELNQGYYNTIDISLPISFEQNHAWFVAPGNKEWLAYLNTWLENFMQTTSYKVLYNKYYLKRRSYISPLNIYTNLEGGRLSAYDDLIKSKCKGTKWDWRLLAAIIYKESGFDPNIVSWAGAKGLMQIMPDAAETFKVENVEIPERNIEAGVRLLNWLDEAYIDEIPNDDERIKFVLASYNVGLGHVRDAQRLAEKYGKIRIVWDNNVDFYLLNKSKKEYYSDPVVKYGYCRGEEPYNYVHRVLDTYHHYCNLIPDPEPKEE